MGVGGGGKVKSGSRGRMECGENGGVKGLERAYKIPKK